MSNKEDAANMINLLAGAAQAGANGVLAHAAYNLMKASEAVVKARKLNASDTIQKNAMSILQNAQDALNQAMQLPGAMDEAKLDIIKANGKPYTPE